MRALVGRYLGELWIFGLWVAGAGAVGLLVGWLG